MVMFHQDSKVWKVKVNIFKNWKQYFWTLRDIFIMFMYDVFFFTLLELKYQFIVHKLEFKKILKP